MGTLIGARRNASRDQHDTLLERLVQTVHRIVREEVQAAIAAVDRIELVDGERRTVIEPGHMTVSTGESSVRVFTTDTEAELRVAAGPEAAPGKAAGVLLYAGDYCSDGGRRAALTVENETGERWEVEK